MAWGNAGTGVPAPPFVTVVPVAVRAVTPVPALPLDLFTPIQSFPRIQEPSAIAVLPMTLHAIFALLRPILFIRGRRRCSGRQDAAQQGRESTSFHGDFLSGSCDDRTTRIATAVGKGILFQSVRSHTPAAGHLFLRTGSSTQL